MGEIQDTKIEDLQEEIRLLKEREASLQRQLIIERQRRLHAEKIIENERNACLELKSLLDHQDKKFRCSLPNYYAKDRAVSMSEVPRMMMDQERTVIMPESGFAVTSSTPSIRQNHIQSHTDEPNDNLAGQRRQIRVRSQSAKLAGRRITLDNSDMSQSVDFATSVFTDLPEDLQEILSPSVDGEDDNSPVQMMRLTIEAGDDKELLQLVKQNGMITESVDDDGSTLLHIAAIKGQLECMKLLLDWGMDPNLFRNGNVTPLMDASACNHSECVKLLLERGGSHKVKDVKGWGPLQWACSKGSLTCLQLLLDCDPEYTDFFVEVVGATSAALHVAVESRHTDILHLLLTYLTSKYGTRTVVDGKGGLGQLVNAADRHGSTPAHVAAGMGSTDCLELLCACPLVDLSVMDQWNRTVNDVATAECKEVLANRECQEVGISLDLTEQFGSQDYTIISHIRVFKYHRWTDFDILVGDALTVHCQDLCRRNTFIRSKPLSGCSSAGSLAGIPNGNSSNSNSPVCSSKQKLNRKTNPLEIIEDMVPVYTNLGLTPASISGYRMGLVTWVPGESPCDPESDSTPFDFFHSRSSSSEEVSSKDDTQVYIKLQATENGKLDQLSYETMIPLDTLQGYLELLEKSQSVIVHGPHGCGKTYLSRQLARCLLKSKNGDPLGGLIHVSLHPNFKRDDLLRLLHVHGALVAASGSNEGNLTSSEGSQSSLPSSNGDHQRVFLLDDIDRVSMPEVIAELLNAFAHRGPAYPVWVDTVQSRSRDTCYHANHYYIRSDCYFIATILHSQSREFNRPFHETFMHIWLSANKEPVRGILHRQLMRKLIHSYEGQIPHHTDPVFAAVQWVSEVWQLLNYYITKMGLVEVMAGPRHFLYCPVERNRSDLVYKWLVELWNHQLVPMIRDVTVYGTPLCQGGKQDMTAHILTTLTQRAIKATCPLDSEGTIQLLCQLEGGQEGISMIEDAKKNRRNLTPSPRAEQRIQTSPGKRWGSNSPLVLQKKHSIDDHHIHLKQTSDSSVEFGHSNGVLSDSPETSLKQLVPIDERVTYARNASHSSSSTTDKEMDGPSVKTPGSEKKRNRFGRMLGRFSRDKRTSEGSSPPSSKRLLSVSSKRSASISESPHKQYLEKNADTPKEEIDDFVDLIFKATSERIDDQRTVAPNINFYSHSLETSNKSLTSYSLPDLLQDDSSEEISDTMAEVHPISVTRSSTVLNNKDSLVQQPNFNDSKYVLRAGSNSSSGVVRALHLDNSQSSIEAVNSSPAIEEHIASKSDSHLQPATKPVKFATSPSMARMDLLVQDSK